MPTIKQVLDGANTVYYKSLNRAEILACIEGVQAVKESPLVNEQNLETAQFLSIKLKLKAHALAFFCEGYENADYSALKAYAEGALATCNPTFKKTVALLKSVLKAAEDVNRLTFDAVVLQSSVRDADGKCVVSDADECVRVADLFKSKIAGVENLNLPANVFSDGAAFVDVKEQLKRDFKEVVDFALNSAAAINARVAEGVMQTAVKDITDRLNALAPRYLPSIVCAERLAPALVLCTPVVEEARLFAYAMAGGAPICELQALALEGVEEQTLAAVFATLKAKGFHVLIYGAPRFRAGNKNAFLRAVINYAKDGTRAYLIADDGTNAVYESALAAVKSSSELSPLNVSLLYLSLPDFSQTLDELKSLGMAEEGDEGGEFIKKLMPFAGFDGLNEGVKAYLSGGDWQKILRERSEDNFKIAKNYMLRLPRQGLFIDGGWGSYHQDVTVNKTKRFDYDDIREVNPLNIKKIMEGNFSLFEKCGMISTYCLLAGASASDWKDFSKELKSKRLSEACKLVMRALDIDIVPVVEVLDELSVKGAGGLCCDGGKKIQYLNSATESFDWTAKSVLHECFHAFQHHAMSSGWQDWYATELHVTHGRIEQWRYNNARYRSIDKGKEVYMIQIFESDARAFEEDCLGTDENRGQILNLLDLD